jgi:hypothetical protein
MSLVLVGVLALFAVVLMFFAPWIGGALLAVAFVAFVALLISASVRGRDEVRAEHEAQPEPPHLPGPSNPASGVE